jgi:CubicO group peptidase (beta-lactamase class C family)
LSDQSGAHAHDEFRDLPQSPSLRHLKLEAKRRLAAGEFPTLHEAQLAVAREHGASSWAVLKQQVAAADAEHGHALAQVRWVFGRYAQAGAPAWTAPDRDELSEHFSDRFLSLAPPATLAHALGDVADRLRADLVLVDAGPLHLRAKVAGLWVEAVAAPDAPHLLTGLRVYPGGGTVTDARVAQPPSTSAGRVPERAAALVEESRADLSLVGLSAAGDRDDGPVPEPWGHCCGWADLDGDVPLRPDHRLPARAITKLVTSTAVLCLVAQGVIELDDPANRRLRALRLADDEVTVRDLLSHTGGVGSPESMWGEQAVEAVDVLGQVVGCSGERGRFAYSNGGYGVLGQLIADVTGSSFAQAAARLVLEPLGMADSWFPERTPLSDDAVRGHKLAPDGSFAPEPLPAFVLQAAGGLWSTGTDLVRFGSGWSSLLPAHLAEEALRPHATPDAPGPAVGLGWLIQEPKDAVGHAGSGPGASASLIIRPSTGRVSVVFTNRLVPVEPVNARLLSATA